jgi:hypothetical protein
LEPGDDTEDSDESEDERSPRRSPARAGPSGSCRSKKNVDESANASGDSVTLLRIYRLSNEHAYNVA